ncbi:type III effector HrpK domain-containing protein [Pokkaliibacter sp. CJK22405]|uniref:type III effector HrpK domain-containing protein n=1 Tax=Pokkaliibacter sp. CJK22405 TaxID=3384615 RepID=UPI003985653A
MHVSNRSITTPETTLTPLAEKQVEAQLKQNPPAAVNSKVVNFGGHRHQGSARASEQGSSTLTEIMDKDADSGVSVLGHIAQFIGQRQSVDRDAGGSVLQGLLGDDDGTVDADDEGDTQPPVSLAPVTEVSKPIATSTSFSSAPTSSILPTVQSADFLDESVYSQADELKGWGSMVQSLPADQRLQAQKQLNRPIAAARMAAEGGMDGAKARAFIDSNPALKAAIDMGKPGSKMEGKITEGKCEAFADRMQRSRSAASKELRDYVRNNPLADDQSLQMVRSAAVLRANEPLTRAADPRYATGTTKLQNVTSDAGLKSLFEDNAGLGSSLQQSARMFSEPGFMSQIAEPTLSNSSSDQRITADSIDQWMRHQAPRNGGEFASMLSDAASVNAVADTDISQLTDDVFNNPEHYSGAQKSALLIRLQQADKLLQGQGSKTDSLRSGLGEHIGQLRQDRDVQAYMSSVVPAQERELISIDPAMANAAKSRFANIATGSQLEKDMQSIQQHWVKSNKDKKPDERNPIDYSAAIGSLENELQLHRDLSSTGQVPTTAQVISTKPELSEMIQRSYQSFGQGSMLRATLKEKGASPEQAVLKADQKKAIYELAMPGSNKSALQQDYLNHGVEALKDSKKGAELIRQQVGEGGSELSLLDAASSDSLSQRLGLSSQQVQPLSMHSAGLGRMSANTSSMIASQPQWLAGTSLGSKLGGMAAPLDRLLGNVVGASDQARSMLGGLSEQRNNKQLLQQVHGLCDQLGIQA